MVKLTLEMLRRIIREETDDSRFDGVTPLQRVESYDAKKFAREHPEEWESWVLLCQEFDEGDAASSHFTVSDDGIYGDGAQEYTQYKWTGDDWVDVGELDDPDFEPHGAREVR